MKISNEARTICREYYDKHCGTCPIRPQCVVPVGGGQEALERWSQAVNEAAESH
ncbi:hypothetical protein [Aneurinibacillus migulanus]|uniref:hypothetical protein n=1 Tax=Aneurinibacillus migulanus TaxID=47500 RepID=UPI000A9AB553|nr:hypothetical protein [Aneurinibacillus migulanus]